MIFIKKSENLSEVLRLFLEELVEDVKLRPFDLIIIVKVIGLQKDLFDLFAIQILEILWVDYFVDISCTFLDHLEDWIYLILPEAGSKALESSLRSAFLPYSLNYLVNLLPS